MPNTRFNVLYVDDEENNLISFRAAFRRDYQVFTALSAEEGMNILHQEQVPIIITDQRMPGITGVQFLEKVIPEFPDTVRMILTGYSDIEAIIQAINTGRVFRYITKPWDETELKMTIDNAINLYRLQQNNKQLIQELNQKVADLQCTLDMFQRYVPAEVIERMMSSGGGSKLFEGEQREVTVLFCDIRGFTKISSRLSPGEVVQVLNLFYRLMSSSITKYSGSVNQYVGDEIFAVFGAPTPNPDHFNCAVYCAIDMLQQLVKLNEMIASTTGDPIRIGIGINTGEVVAGNLGTDEKIAYSITGDTVNMAKRIEQLTQDKPNTILISDSTFQRVPNLFHVSTWAPVHVKGKETELVVHEILGRK
jgi:class 3 adenylate cyclase